MRRLVEFNIGDTVHAYSWPEDITFTITNMFQIDGVPYFTLRAGNGDLYRMPKLHVCHYPLHQRK